jgi:hypothetical protein
MTLRCAVLILLCSAANPWPASAADIVLDGEAACLSIGGVWSGAACAVDRLIVPADTRLFTVMGISLSTGELVIDGVLQIEGDFEPTRTLLNRGTLITRSFIVSRAQLLNQGTWLNQGSFYSDSTVVNEWIFDNRGIFETRAGMFINRGYTVIVSGAHIWNSGGLMVNEGNVYNYGYLHNPAGSILDNAGVIVTYDATLFNYGRALGRCGSAYYFQYPWYLVGNAVEFEPCSGADAVGALANDVLALGNRRVLSKDDTILLSGLLFKSSKRLQTGDEVQGVELLQMFIAEVPRRTAFPIDNLLLARAHAALALVASP